MFLSSSLVFIVGLFFHCIWLALISVASLKPLELFPCCFCFPLSPTFTSHTPDLHSALVPAALSMPGGTCVCMCVRVPVLASTDGHKTTAEKKKKAGIILTNHTVATLREHERTCKSWEKTKEKSWGTANPVDKSPSWSDLQNPQQRLNLGYHVLHWSWHLYGPHMATETYQSRGVAAQKPRPAASA